MIFKNNFNKLTFSCVFAILVASGLTACEPVVGPIDIDIPTQLSYDLDRVVQKSEDLNTAINNDPSTSESTRFSNDTGKQIVKNIRARIQGTANTGNELYTASRVAEAFIPIVDQIEKDLSALKVTTKVTDLQKSLKNLVLSLSQMAAQRLTNAEKSPGFDSGIFIDSTIQSITKNPLYEGGSSLLASNSDNKGDLTYEVNCPQEAGSFDLELVSGNGKLQKTSSGIGKVSLSGNYYPDEVYFARLKPKASSWTAVACKISFSTAHPNVFPLYPLSDSAVANINKAMEQVQQLDAQFSAQIGRAEAEALKSKNQETLDWINTVRESARLAAHEAAHVVQQAAGLRTSVSEVTATEAISSVADVVIDALLNAPIASQPQFSTVANILKVRHETVKNAIANVR